MTAVKYRFTMEVMFLGLWLIILAMFTPRQAAAAGEFATSYRVNYRVSTDGVTRAKIEVELVNRLSNIYASEFNLTIGSTHMSGVTLTTASGPVEPKVTVGSKTTNITVVFPEKVLGKDNSQRFTLEFATTDFARKLGDVWEVSIPKLAEADGLDGYQLDLVIPAAMGQAATITPAPDSQVSDTSATTFRWQDESLYQNGIFATFGRIQHYDFRLRYQLNNPHFYPVSTEIALPPDTLWQQVLYQTLTPEPVNIRTDADGNWLATYRLAASSGMEVTATGSADLFLNPRDNFPQKLNQTVNYLKPLQYWETEASRIKALARELATPRKIYDYVVNNLIYDYGRLGTPTRLGAANALDSQNSALCLEFTDLFVALARAAGIPARAVNGYAYTDNPQLRPLSLKQDVLHAWPEYYDQARQMWRPIDPTWGNTTGGVDYFSQTDLNHFAFAILGADSNYPIPAGGYKAGGEPVKNVEVSFGRSLLPREELAIAIDLPDKALAGVSLAGKIKVTNTGNAALYHLPLTLSGNEQRFSPQSWEIETLPPFASAEVDFTLPASGWNTYLALDLVAETGLARAEHRVRLLPAYRLAAGHPWVRGGLIVAGALIMLKLIHAILVKAKSAQ